MLGHSAWGAGKWLQVPNHGLHSWSGPTPSRKCGHLTLELGLPSVFPGAVCQIQKQLVDPHCQPARGLCDAPAWYPRLSTDLGPQLLLPPVSSCEGQTSS